MTSVMFTVPGKPQGKARARTYYNASTKKHCSTTPDNTVLYENFIKDRYLQMAKGAFLEREKPVTLRIIARYLPPKSVSKKRKLDMLEGKEAAAEETGYGQYCEGGSRCTERCCLS